MAEKLEDLNLPNATVAKIIKEALPDAINVAKDAKAALSRAASVFVLYLTSQACSEAQKEKRKTLLGTDVIKALEELEFDDFIEPLQEVLRDLKENKVKARAGKSKKGDNDTEEDTEHDESQEEEPMDEESGD